MPPWARRTSIAAVIGGILLYIADAATQGAIGKLATDILIPQTVIFVTKTHWPPFLTPLFFSAFLVSALGGVYAYWHTNEMARKKLNSTADIYDNLIKMDDSLFGFTPRMIEARTTSMDELDNKTQRVIEYLLESAIAMFHPEVQAGALFTLDSADNKLKIWAHRNMSQATIGSAQFDISPNVNHPAGMARASYLNEHIEVGCIERNGNEWRCSNDNYIKINTGPTGVPPNDPPLPPYSSLVCVPVIHRLTSQVPLGVISFNSFDKTAFNDPEINKLLVQLANRIAQALVIYQFLRVLTL